MVLHIGLYTLLHANYYELFYNVKRKYLYHEAGTTYYRNGEYTTNTFTEGWNHIVVLELT